MTVEQIVQQALALPFADRVELAQSLLLSVRETQPVIHDPEFIDQVRSRVHDFDEGLVVGHTHEEVMRNARRALGCE